jgi:predicted nucleic acid-binding protein
MNYVVDASVAVKWYVPEAHSAEAERLLDPMLHLSSPELVLPEFGQIIWKKVRRGELSERAGQRIIKAFDKAGVTLHAHSSVFIAAYTGAILTGQTVYDWTYLALAVALDCELVTADKSFYQYIAQTKLNRYLLWVGDIR